MYFAYLVAIGVLTPLLAYAVYDTLSAYVSYKARNVSAAVRDAAAVKLEAIVRTPSAPEDARGFASHLLRLVADTDVMRERGEWIIDHQNEIEQTGDNEESESVASLKALVGPVYVERFERIFPLLTTASLLLHPSLGRVFYFTIKRTAAVSAVSQRTMRRAENIIEKKGAPQPTPLLFQSAHSRDEQLWECAA